VTGAASPLLLPNAKSWTVAIGFKNKTVDTNFTNFH